MRRLKAMTIIPLLICLPVSVLAEGSAEDTGVSTRETLSWRRRETYSGKNGGELPYSSGAI